MVSYSFLHYITILPKRVRITENYFDKVRLRNAQRPVGKTVINYGEHIATSGARPSNYSER